ncbi:hypothetical protein OSB04_001631 [Centaurea solstitialis]|uniref:Uncharacterized protein n=1 Tax=Centaurea solstitialis TaxID=347529 RepID=A0AA38TRD7_9ASTR|nr:hypothetical protein OSB04_001631 [Centaurea solstitialis]
MDIHEKVNQRLEATIFEVVRLPKKLATVPDAMVAFLQVVGPLNGTVQKIFISGEYGNYENGKPMHCNARMVEMLDVFSRELHSSIKISKSSLVEGMRVVEEAADIRLPDFFPHSAFMSYPQLLPFMKKATHVMGKIKNKLVERVFEIIEMDKNWMVDWIVLLLRFIVMQMVNTEIRKDIVNKVLVNDGGLENIMFEPLSVATKRKIHGKNIELLKKAKQVIEQAMIGGGMAKKTPNPDGETRTSFTFEAGRVSLFWGGFGFGDFFEDEDVARLAFVCVRNRIGEETHTEDRTQEYILFDTHQMLSKVDKSMMGIPVLATRLVDIQSMIISKCLPDILEKLSTIASFMKKATHHAMGKIKNKLVERVVEMIKMEKVTDYTCDLNLCAFLEKLMGIRD